MEDIKKYEGSINFDDFADNLLHYGGCRTYGDVWEKCVSCNHCEYEKACEAICDKIAEAHDVDIKCSQVINVLLGYKKIDDIIKEAKANDRW